MNRNPARALSSFPAHPGRPMRDRAACQPLEARRLLAIAITWTNRGSDNFGIYGASAAQARLIVDRALDSWEEVITNFNRANGTNTYSVTFDALSIDGRGATGINSFNAGKPTSASIQLDDNGGGAGWYFDTFIGLDGIPDDGEFDVPITPFTAGGGVSDADFYRTVVHELGHAMGITSNSSGLLSGFAHDVGDDPNSGSAADRLFGIDIGNNGTDEYTVTNDGGFHLFEGGGGYTGPVHPNALMNSGRTYVSGRRQLIGDVESDILRDAYGYTVVSPNLINTFWANLDRTANVLTVTGDINPSGSDNDSIIVDVVGTDTRIRVGGTTELIPSAEYTTLVINAGEGNDTIRIDGLPAGKGVTVNGGNGNDSIVLADVLADLDTAIDSDVSINGGAGTDSVRADDQLDGANSDIYNVTSTSLTKVGVSRTFNLNADLEELTINASNQNSVFNITSTSYNLIVNGGTGNETLNVGGGDVDTNLVGNVTLNGGGGTDRLDLEDATDAVGSDTWTFTVGLVNKGGQLVNYAGIEAMTVNASAQANVFNLDALGIVLTTVNGGAGGETFFVGNGDLDTNIDANVTLNGGGGTDSVTFEDQLDAAGGNTYTLVSNQLNKGGRLFNYSGFESLVITGSATAAVYNINGSSSATTVVNGGGAADTVNVGGGDVDTNLGANITVNGGAGADALIFDDTADGAGANVATFTSGVIVKGGQTFNYGSFATLVWNGATLATTYNINGTVLGTPITVNGGAGNDTLNIGGGDFDSNVNGNVDFNGQGGTDRLVVDDTADQASPIDTYDINGGSFTKSSASGITVGWAGIIFGSVTIEQLVVNASAFANLINVNALGGTGLTLPPTPPPVFPVNATVNAGDGNDTINVAAGGQLTSLRGNISVNGGLGVDSVTFNDAADTDNDAFFLTHNTLTNLDWDFAASFNTSNDVTILNAGSGNNIINYEATAAAPATILLNGNNGVDTYNIVEGVATVRGGAGLDPVNVNETQAGTATAVFDTNQDLGTLSIFMGGTALVPVNGAIALDTNTLGTLRGTLNLNNNTAVVRSPTLSFLVDKLARGYNAGAWNGVPAGGPSGVITSATANSTALGDGIGYAQIGGGAGQLNLAVVQGVNVVAGNVVMTYTLNGDTNLDRSVGFPDLVSLAQNYNLVGTHWVQGNFNYDNVVDFPDLVSLAQNYNASVLQSASQAADLATWPLGTREMDRLASSSLIDDTLFEQAWDQRSVNRNKKPA